MLVFFKIFRNSAEESMQFIVGDLVFDTEKATELAKGEARESRLSGFFIFADYIRRQATFYRSPTGCLFSVDQGAVSNLPRMVDGRGWIEDPRHTSCRVYSSETECLAAMQDPQYGRIDPSEALTILGIGLREA
jgi:hypothetical protein